jgi:hypothetical protein
VIGDSLNQAIQRRELRRSVESGVRFYSLRFPGNRRGLRKRGDLALGRDKAAGAAVATAQAAAVPGGNTVGGAGAISRAWDSQPRASSNRMTGERSRGQLLIRPILARIYPITGSRVSRESALPTRPGSHGDISTTDGQIPYSLLGSDPGRRPAG